MKAKHIHASNGTAPINANKKKVPVCFFAMAANVRGEYDTERISLDTARGNKNMCNLLFTGNAYAKDNAHLKQETGSTEDDHKNAYAHGVVHNKRAKRWAINHKFAALQAVWLTHEANWMDGAISETDEYESQSRSRSRRRNNSRRPREGHGGQTSPSSRHSRRQASHRSRSQPSQHYTNQENQHRYSRHTHDMNSPPTSRTRTRSRGTTPDQAHLPTGSQLLQRERSRHEHHLQQRRQAAEDNQKAEENQADIEKTIDLAQETHTRNYDIQIRKHISDTAAATIKPGDTQGVELGDITRAIRNSCPPAIEVEELTASAVQEVLTKAYHRFHTHNGRGKTVFTRAQKKH